jgi:hypothetical protein
MSAGRPVCAARTEGREELFCPAVAAGKAMTLEAMRAAEPIPDRCMRTVGFYLVGLIIPGEVGRLSARTARSISPGRAGASGPAVSTSLWSVTALIHRGDEDWPFGCMHHSREEENEPPTGMRPCTEFMLY